MARGKKASIRAVDPEVLSHPLPAGLRREFKDIVACSLEAWYPSLTVEERDQIAKCVLEEIWT